MAIDIPRRQKRSARRQESHNFLQQLRGSSFVILEQTRRAMQRGEFFDSFVEIVEQSFPFGLDLQLTHIMTWVMAGNNLKNLAS